MTKGSKIFFAVFIIIVLVAFGFSIWGIAKREILPPPDEYGFLIETSSGDYIADEIAFYEGYLVLEDYYSIFCDGILGARGDHHTNTLLLSGDKITITSRVEGED